MQFSCWYLNHNVSGKLMCIINVPFSPKPCVLSPGVGPDPWRRERFGLYDRCLQGLLPAAMSAILPPSSVLLGLPLTDGMLSKLWETTVKQIMLHQEVKGTAKWGRQPKQTSNHYLLCVCVRACECPKRAIPFNNSNLKDCFDSWVEWQGRTTVLMHWLNQQLTWSVYCHFKHFAEITTRMMTRWDIKLCM